MKQPLIIRIQKSILRKRKPIIQNYDDFDNGFDTGWNAAIEFILKLIEGKTKSWKRNA